MSERIAKHRAGSGLRPNLADYAEARRRFSWADARRELQGWPKGRGLNIAHEAVDRRRETPE